MLASLKESRAITRKKQDCKEPETERRKFLKTWLGWKRGGTGSFQRGTEELRGHIWKASHVLHVAKVRAQNKAVVTNTSEDFCSGGERKKKSGLEKL